MIFGPPLPSPLPPLRGGEGTDRFSPEDCQSVASINSFFPMLFRRGALINPLSPTQWWERAGERGSKILLSSLFLLTLTNCSFAPKIQRPDMGIPPAYREPLPQNKHVKWVAVHPQKLRLDTSAWWKMYHDPILNKLESQVSNSNQDIRVSLARFDAARAELIGARAAYFPKIIGVANTYRQQLSHSSAATSRATSAANNGTFINNLTLYNDNLLIGNIYYELDVWGRVRNSVAYSRDLFHASAAEVSVIALSMHAQLASAYFSLRGYDAAQRVLDDTVNAYQKAYDLTRRRYHGGADPVGNVDQALTQLETAKTAAADTHLKRAQVEHAIATLIGRLPAAVRIKPQSYKNKRVTIAPDLPSTLIERRPDIAAAALRIQAANANIGVARAAFFPQFNLTAGLGLESASLSHLLSHPSLVWALGSTTATALLNSGNMPLLTQLIFDGGKIKALTEQAIAEYFEMVAQYRQTVLTAYQEVEDNLVALRQLDQEYTTQSTAVRAARHALTQETYRYKEGLTDYLPVVIAENTALQAQLELVDISTRRQMASVMLIKALGGGWHCQGFDPHPVVKRLVKKMS